MTVPRTSPTSGAIAAVLLLLGATVAAPIPSRGQDPGTAQEKDQSQDRNRDTTQDQNGGQDRTQGRGTVPDPVLTEPDAVPVAGRPISPLDALPVAARHNPLELSAPSGAARLPHYNWDGTRSIIVPARRVPANGSDVTDGSDATDRNDATDRGDARRTRTKRQAPLPLFIYDYFEPARRIIEARRTAARARYAPGRYPPGSYPPGVNRPNRGRPNNRNSSQRPSPASGDGMPRQGGLLGNDGTQPPQDETTRRGGMDAQNQYSQSQIPSQYSQEQGQYSQERNPQGTSLMRQNQAGRNQALPPTRPDADAASSSTTSSSLERQDQKRRDLENGGTPPDEGGQGGSNERNGNGQDENANGFGGQNGNANGFGGQDGNANGFAGAVDPLTQINSSLTASIPPSYQLAPGDALTVRYWSATHPAHEFRTTVDAQGALTLDQGRRLVVRGLTLAQA